MLIDEIGRGMHGKVKLAEDMDTGDLVAIKIVEKQTKRKQLYTKISSSLTETELKIRREIAILKKCSHPNVVQLKEVIDDPTSKKIYLALEYMEHGEVEWRNDYSQPVLSVNTSRSICRDIISGLDYLHYQGIVHRDIKPANLLLTKDSRVKISDFGVSYFNRHLAGDMNQYDDKIDKELSETVGTPAFFAPELCSTNHQPITKAIDVWALGVTLFCFIYGRCPFTASNEFELFDKIPTQPLIFPSDIIISSPLKDLLTRLLTKNPEKRITLEEVKHHPWILEGLEDPRQWWYKSDPSSYQPVVITEDDINHAVTFMDRIVKSIHKLSTSISHSFTKKTTRQSISSEFTVT
ncbi:kinase-like domain-containing protein [Pilobolus umbonatus]|nr:kinase-like domain-containing protein [Pilobolus umbonatus]